MARQYTIKVGVDTVTIGDQRNSTGNPDNDFLTIWVTTSHSDNDRFHNGPISIGTSLSSGQTVAPDPAPEVGEFIVTDDDSFAIKCYAVNQSHTDPNKALDTGLKIVAAVAGSLAAGEALAAISTFNKATSSFLANEAVASGAVAAIAALADFSITTLASALGLSAPDCDGPVFDPQEEMKFHVGEMVLNIERVNEGRLPVGVRMFLGVWTDDTQISQTGCGHNPVTTIRPMITFTQDPMPVQEFSQSLVGPPVKVKPFLARPVTQWVNTWVDGHFVENSDIVLNISSQPVLHFEVGGGHLPAAPATQVANFPQRLLTNPNLAALLGASPVTVAQGSNSAASDGELSVEITEKFAGTHRLAIQASSPGLASVPMAAFPFDKNVLAPDPNLAIFHAKDTPSGIGATATVSTPASDVKLETTGAQKVHVGLLGSAQITGATAELPATGGTGHLGAGAIGGASAAPQLTPAFSDSVVVGQGVTLQFFGAFDANDRFVAPRLRYLRVDGAGKILVDAMLQPAEVPIK
jgi:hypothetical protein